MKSYRTPRQLQAEIEQVLQRPFSANSAPLDEVAQILCEGRHYDWIGIYVVAGERSAGADTSRTVAETRPGIVTSIRLGQHTFGAIEVRAEDGRRLAGEERILLKQVAARLAKFLHGPGAWLVRKAREAAAALPPTPQARGHQPTSEKAQERSLAAAGEGRR